MFRVDAKAQTCDSIRHIPGVDTLIYLTELCYITKFESNNIYFLIFVKFYFLVWILLRFSCSECVRLRFICTIYLLSSILPTKIININLFNHMITSIILLKKHIISITNANLHRLIIKLSTYFSIFYYETINTLKFRGYALKILNEPSTFDSL